jgi:ATP synthase protein I
MADRKTPDERRPALNNASAHMLRAVGANQDRILKARTSKDNFWGALELLGVVGWSVALPTLLGIVAGTFLDRHWPARISWTLTFLSAGLLFGCTNAWLHMRGKQPGKKQGDEPERKP